MRAVAMQEKALEEDGEEPMSDKERENDNHESSPLRVSDERRNRSTERRRNLKDSVSLPGSQLAVGALHGLLVQGEAKDYMRKTLGISSEA